MTEELALIVKTADCIGCKACEIACKQEHQTRVGPRWIKVAPGEPKKIEGKMQLRFSVSHCLHCTEPGCLAACPVSAISKRADGIVLVDAELCTGCGLCVDACPIGVMQFDDNAGKAEKCDLCVARLDRGLKPACVAACQAQCIYYGPTSEVFVKTGKPELLAVYKK